MNAISTTAVLLLSALLIPSCSQPRQPTTVEHAVQPSISHYVGDDLSRVVPPALVATTTAALDLLYSEQAASYANWPDALKGIPPKGPFKQFSVQRLSSVGQANVVRIFLQESDPGNGRSFSVYWDEETARCQDIRVSMR